MTGLFNATTADQLEQRIARERLTYQTPGLIQLPRKRPASPAPVIAAPTPV